TDNRFPGGEPVNRCILNLLMIDHFLSEHPRLLCPRNFCTASKSFVASKSRIAAVWRTAWKFTVRPNHRIDKRCQARRKWLVSSSQPRQVRSNGAAVVRRVPSAPARGQSE